MPVVSTVRGMLERCRPSGLIMSNGRRVWHRVLVIVRRMSRRGRVHSWAPLLHRCVDIEWFVLTIDSVAVLTVPVSARTASMVSGVTIALHDDVRVEECPPAGRGAADVPSLFPCCRTLSGCNHPGAEHMVTRRESVGRFARRTVTDVTSLVASAILRERPTLEVESPRDPG